MPLKYFKSLLMGLGFFVGSLTFLFSFSVSASSVVDINQLQSLIKGHDLTTGKDLDNPLNSNKTSNKTKVKGKVLVFLSMKCPCSAGHLSHLQILNEKYSDFQFIGIHANQDEPEAIAQNFFQKKFQEKLINFPVMHDEKANLANFLGALKTPHVFVIDPQGNILFQGGVTNSMNFNSAKIYYLQEALELISAGKKPNSEMAKAIGCYIQR